MFFTKRKAIHVDCFTDRKFVFDTAKPDRAGKFYPDWWKKLPRTNTVSHVDRATMKHCRGFLDLYSTGFIMPLWSDFNVHFGSDGSYQWEYADGVSVAELHPQWQRGSFAEDMPNMKLLSPWRFKEKTGVKFFNAQCFWNDGPVNQYHVVPGVIDFKYQNAPHANMLFNTGGEEKNFFMPFGTPLVHYIPVSEKPVVLHHHLVDSQEFQHIKEEHAPIKFVNKYRAVKQIKDQKQCPFRSMFKQ
jgi:hypothetical protein